MDTDIDMDMNVTADEREASDLASTQRKLKYSGLLKDAIKTEAAASRHTALQTMQTVQMISKTSLELLESVDCQDHCGRTLEMVLGAQVLNKNRQAFNKVIDNSAEYSAQRYVESVVKLIGDLSSPNWDAFSDIAISLARTAHVHVTLYGSIDPDQELIVKERQTRRTQTKLAEKKCAEKVVKLKSRDKGATKISIIHDQLIALFVQRKKKTLPFFELVIDPHEFANTVENAFQMAFLARDNRIGIVTGEDGFPHVCLIKDGANKKECQTIQSICSIDYAICDEMIAKYNITKALLKVPENALDEE